MRINRWRDLDPVEQRAALQRPVAASDTEKNAAVALIIAAVREHGDRALSEHTAQFDGATLGEFRVGDDEIREAERQLAKNSVAAIDLAIRNVRAFHEAQISTAIAVETMPGVRCERIAHAIDSVGLYVPAGTAPLPSAAIMLAVPASVAKCPVRIMCTPPRPDGTADPAVLVAATRSGIRDIFKIGGAQAIAAMAYGTESVPRVCKIFGPGNSWVTLAKSQVSSSADGAAIDMPAGPSEVLVIADASASAQFVAADLLSQAEHGSDSQVILVTTSSDLAQEVDQAVTRQLSQLSREQFASGALSNSRIIIVEDIETAIRVSNSYAPEHLLLQINSAREWLPEIRNAGSVFVGRWTPESVGDYCSGTNHVLPTYGYARAYSGLGVDQFQRQMTIQELTATGLRGLADSVLELARLEGLDAHAAAVRVRMDELQ